MEGISANLTVSDFKVDNDNVFINPRIMRGNPGMLLVWATWCSHCVKFKPIYQKMTSQLNQVGDSFACLAIDNDELKKDNGAISSALNVKGFPTICWVAQDGKVIGQYEGGRDMNSILTQVCNVYHHCVEHHSL